MRRIGSEFLGKRQSMHLLDWIQHLCQEQEEEQDRPVCQCVQRTVWSISSDVRPARLTSSKRGLGAILLSGKRMTNKMNAVQRRTIGSEFLGKRALGSEFLGKRLLGSEFLGKRALGSEFLGKRAGSEMSTPDSDPYADAAETQSD